MGLDLIAPHFFGTVQGTVRATDVFRGRSRRINDRVAHANRHLLHLREKMRLDFGPHTLKQGVHRLR